MAAVITAAAGKGGVGRTATAVNPAMAPDGHKALAVATGTQANSTMFLTGQRLADNAFKGKGG